VSDLTFGDLRALNVARCVDVFHAINDWSPTDWACAMAGECGEACNEVKKLRRLDGDDADFDTVEQRAKLRIKIGKELADLVIYADLLAKRLDLDLARCVVEKFNEVSERRGSTIKL
jgi:NTP pyrophosphatase (non-canonical NTP hydrolase)